VLDFARDVLKLPRVLATTRPYNSSSANLLNKLGLRFKHRISYPGGDGELMLFTTPGSSERP
jgi:RimJ/RimL family protein N-acetyltransferase